MLNSIKVLYGAFKELFKTLFGLKKYRKIAELWGLGILATQKIVLMVLSPGGIFAHLRAKKAIFDQFSKKFHVF